MDRGRRCALEHLLVADSSSRGILVLAHGAGAGMRHAFLERLAQALAARKVATFRYEFVYMEKGGGRPDPPAVAAARVREAVAAAADAAGPAPVRRRQVVRGSDDVDRGG